RTARMEAVGDAVTFVSREEEGDFRQIERAMGTRIPRRTLPGFNYEARASEGLEIPLGERSAGIGERQAAERARAGAKDERRPVPLLRTCGDRPRRAPSA